jgi:hypothetical protein
MLESRPQAPNRGSCPPSTPPPLGDRGQRAARINHVLCWSTTVIMKIDLAGPHRLGYARPLAGLSPWSCGRPAATPTWKPPASQHDLHRGPGPQQAAPRPGAAATSLRERRPAQPGKHRPASGSCGHPCRRLERTRSRSGGLAGRMTWRSFWHPQGAGACLVSASPCRPAQPVAGIRHGPGEQSLEPASRRGRHVHVAVAGRVSS